MVGFIYRHCLSLMLFVGVSAGLIGCGSKASSTDAAAASSSSASTDPSSQTNVGGHANAAAQQSMQAADDAGGSAASTQAVAPAASAKANFFAGQTDVSITAGTGSTDAGPNPGLHAQLGCMADMNFTQQGNMVTIAAHFGHAGCKRGKRNVEGNETIHFDAGTKTMDISGTTVVTLPDGSAITTSPLDSNRPMVSLARSGRPSTGSVALQVSLNQHRQAVTAQNANWFNMEIHTAVQSPITVTNAYTADGKALQTAVPSSRTINGVITVHHLLAGFVATQTHTAVTRDLTGTCSCPSSGTIAQAVVYDADQTGYLRTTTFTGCGTATVVTSLSTHPAVANGSADIVWAGCN
jgi:hypothetical protein